MSWRGVPVSGSTASDTSAPRAESSSARAFSVRSLTVTPGTVPVAGRAAKRVSARESKYGGTPLDPSPPLPTAPAVAGNANSAAARPTGADRSRMPIPARPPRQRAGSHEVASVTGRAAAVRIAAAGLRDEAPVVAGRVKRELQHPEGARVDRLAVRLDRAERVMLLAARAHHELPDPARGVQRPGGRLRREPLVGVGVAAQDHLRAGVVQVLPERAHLRVVA